MGSRKAVLWRESEGKKEPAWFSRWSIIHVLSGVALEAGSRHLTFNKGLALTLFIHTLYELKDMLVSYYTIGRNTYDHGWRDNSVQNSIGDTLAVVCGFCLSRMYLQGVPRRVLVLIYALAVLVEYNRLEDAGRAL